MFEGEGNKYESDKINDSDLPKIYDVLQSILDGDPH